jgi:hypothetical protein
MPNLINTLLVDQYERSLGEVSDVVVIADRGRGQGGADAPWDPHGVVRLTGVNHS